MLTTEKWFDFVHRCPRFTQFCTLVGHHCSVTAAKEAPTLRRKKESYSSLVLSPSHISENKQLLLWALP